MRLPRWAWLALVLGCAGAPGAAPPAEAEAASTPGGEDGPALVVRNGGHQPICAVFFSPAASETWGRNQLDEGERIAPGATRGFYVPAGSYDVKLESCEQAVLLDRRGVDVVGDGVLLTYQ